MGKKEYKCPKCNGTGMVAKTGMWGNVIGEKTCPNCGGTGVIEK